MATSRIQERRKAIQEAVKEDDTRKADIRKELETIQQERMALSKERATAEREHRELMSELDGESTELDSREQRLIEENNKLSQSPVPVPVPAPTPVPVPVIPSVPAQPVVSNGNTATPPPADDSTTSWPAYSKAVDRASHAPQSHDSSATNASDDYSSDPKDNSPIGRLKGILAKVKDSASNNDSFA